MTTTRIVVPLGTRNPEAAVAAASGAGRHAPASWLPATSTDIRIVVAMLGMRYQAKHARVVTTKPRRRRLAPLGRTTGLVSLVAAGAIMAVGTSSSLFNSSASSSDSGIASGTVSLSNTASSACAATNVAPGKPISDCTLTVTYGGTTPGYMGLDIFIAAKAGSGGNRLYNPSDSTHDLDVTISDGSTPFTIPATGTTCPTTGTYTTLNGYTCYELDNELVSLSTFSNGNTRTFTTSASLPTGTPAAENPYQGGTAAVLLSVHAAQAGNQTLGTCTAGAVCNSIQWS